MKTILALVTLALCTPALAADVPAKTTEFVDKVAVSNKFEIDTSQLALKYGKDEDVKKFAQQMIDDHTKAGEDFKAAVKDAGIEQPADSLDMSHNATYAKLRVFTTEAGFDASYLSAQLDAHKDAVALFRDYAANGSTPPLKAFAEKTLPTLEHHLMMVEELSAKHAK